MVRLFALAALALVVATPAFGQQDAASVGPAGAPANAQQAPAGSPALPQSTVPTITNRAPQAATLPPAPPTAPSTVMPTVTAAQPPAVGDRNEFQDVVAQSLGSDLPLFGYNLFRNVPSTFAPLDRIPVTPDYVIGPGDEILIRAWGQVDIDYRATVDRDGAISIPKVGNINVAGLKFQDLEGYLKSAIGRIFRDFQLNVAMGQLRSIDVFVVGQAARPGTYTVSSLSTLVNAIFASGGPTAKGSMRHIQLKRGDKLVTDFDMYDLLIKGDKSKDVRLLPGDVIYIPPIGALAAIAGSVNTPAIYEYQGSLQGLIALAGGLANTAAGQKVAVERIMDRKTRHVDEFVLDKNGLARALQDGDLVKVAAVSPRFDNAVTVRGNVASTARLPWREGMRVTDVIPNEDALITPDYWKKQNLLTVGSQPVGGGAALGALMPQGAFRSETNSGQLGAENAVTGQKKLIEDIRRSTAEVNWDYAVIERLQPDLSTTLVPFNLGAAVRDHDAGQNILLRPGDVITIFSKDDIQVPIVEQSKFVRLEGEFFHAGVYRAERGETLRQLVTRVGGLTSGAYVFGATFTRESTRILQQKQLDEAVKRLQADVESSASRAVAGAITPEDSANAKTQLESQRALVAQLSKVQATGRIVLEVSPDSGIKDVPDVALEDGDRFFVPSKPATVNVLGAVYNENAFLFRQDKRFSDYLTQAGGPTRDADSGRIYVIRADGSVVSKQSTSLFSRFDGNRLNPGDTIVVPQDLQRTTLVKELRDWTQILYQFGLGAAALKVLKQ